MFVSIRRLTASALTGLAVAGLATAPALGQTGNNNDNKNGNNNPNFRMPAAVPGSGQPGGTTAVLGQANPNAAVRPYTPPLGPGPVITPGLYGGTATITSSPYGNTQTAFTPYGGGGYGGYGMFPFNSGNGSLRGVADVTNANGQYQVQIQQARMAQAEADMARIDVRRRLFDEAAYEQRMMPNPEEVRVNEMNAALNRARREPPITEILSGRALNDLYTFLAAQLAKGNRGPNVPLDEDMLKQINLTTGVGGNVGILKDGGKLQWPLSLQAAEFNEPRKHLEQSMAEMAQRLKFNNPPEPAILRDMLADMKKLSDTLTRSVGEMSPSQFIEAKRYLNHLDDAVKALQDPNVANFFTKKWTANGRTVAELIKNMSDQGLRFAPAAPGDVPAYRALHQSMAAFDAGMAQLAATPR